MNTATGPSSHTVDWFREQERRRATRSYGVFFGWICAALGCFALVVMLASDVEPANCTGWCMSDRDGLLLLGLLFGLYVLLALIVVGLIATALLNRRRMSSLATGTLAFFLTAAAIAALFIRFAMM